MSTVHCPLPTALDALRVEIAPGPPPAPTDAMLARWDSLRARTPRLFNGPILAFVGYDDSTRVVHARRDFYMRLACQDEHDPPEVMLLGVTGLLIAPGRDAVPRVMLGKRSRDVWACPGLWEFGPAGGLSAPGVFDRDAPATITGAAVLDHLLREIREETGIAEPPARATVECLTIDREGRGADIVIRAEYVAPPETLSRSDAPDSWEYDETRWLTLAELAVFTASHGDEMIAPTRAIARGLVGG
ncbi:MAG: NUDIX domain-containing protein [Phycisphaerales bacterium]|nr:NUDIX domain-containing protein [Phycisphaerales bacterium]